MTAEIKCGSRWWFIGPGPGRGHLHTVIAVEPGEVVT